MIRFKERIRRGEGKRRSGDVAVLEDAGRNPQWGFRPKAGTGIIAGSYSDN